MQLTKMLKVTPEELFDALAGFIMQDIENATGCFMFIRTELFREIGGFDKRYFMYFEDCDLTREVNARSRTVYYPGATVYHEWGRESKKNFRLKLIQINSMLRYYSKWGFAK